MRSQYTPTIILSAELSDFTDKENKQRTDILDGMLSDMGMIYERARGSYKGVPEISFICLPRNKTEREIIESYAFDIFEQESVLIQDNEGTALLYDGLSELKIGRLKKVSEATALKADGYTKKSDGTFWIVTD